MHAVTDGDDQRFEARQIRGIQGKRAERACVRVESSVAGLYGGERSL